MRGEHLRIIGAFARDLLPEVVLDQGEVDLAFQHGAQNLALRIVGNAGELDRRKVVAGRSGLQRFHNPFPAADTDKIADIKGDGDARQSLCCPLPPSTR